MALWIDFIVFINRQNPHKLQKQIGSVEVGGEGFLAELSYSSTHVRGRLPTAAFTVQGAPFTKPYELLDSLSTSCFPDQDTVTVKGKLSNDLLWKKSGQKYYLVIIKMSVYLLIKSNWLEFYKKTLLWISLMRAFLKIQYYSFLIKTKIVFCAYRKSLFKNEIVEIETQ